VDDADCDFEATGELIKRVRSIDHSSSFGSCATGITSLAQCGKTPDITSSDLSI
jgi:hypothetical protein